MDFLTHRLKKNLLVYSECHFTKKLTLGKRKVSGLEEFFDKIAMISVAANSQLISEVCLCPRFGREEISELDIHR